VTIHLDTSVLVEILTRTRPLFAAYQTAVADGHRLRLSTITLYEWMRGPRVDLELTNRQRLFPDSDVVTFSVAEATRAARLYRDVARGRGREFDIAVAACAIEHDAAVWTLNQDDFKDIPDLQLYVAPKTRLS
jgi:predicted nucleic acid-binding protein